VTYRFQGYFRGDSHIGSKVYESDAFDRISSSQFTCPFYIGRCETRHFWWFANSIWNTSEDFDDPLVVKGVILKQMESKRRRDERARADATGEVPPKYRRPKSTTTSAALNPWKILEVPKGASLSQIKKAYRVQMLLYHPDKAAHLGRDLQELAERKTKEINWAYELVTNQAD
jgi:DnaJ domain